MQRHAMHSSMPAMDSRDQVCDARERGLSEHGKTSCTDPDIGVVAGAQLCCLHI